MYFETLDEFERHCKSNNILKLKHRAYSAVVYVPEHCIVDFGPSAWPPKYLKKQVCPQILLTQVWSDGRSGFIGGMINKDESIIDGLNREFLEETGSSMNFTESEYLFTYLDIINSQAIHMFCVVTNNQLQIHSLLVNFHTNPHRDAYLDEVYGLIAYPLWIEGPEDPCLISWSNNVWGLPRHLVLNGGFLSASNDYIVREQFLLVLIRIGLINETVLRRIITLANSLKCEHDIPLKSVEEMINIEGFLKVSKF